MNNIAAQAYSLKMQTVMPKVEQIKTLEKQYDHLMGALKEDYKRCVGKWGAYTLNVSIRPGTVEYSKIPQLQGVDLEPYRKESVQVYKLEYLGE